MATRFRSVAVLIMLLGFSVIVGGLTGCGDAEGTPKGSGHGSGPAKLEALAGTPPFAITCTVGMLGDVAARLGGDRLRVESLMGPGTDPHLYTATPDDRKKLLAADAIFFCGHHLEGRMADVLAHVGRRKAAVAVCEQIDPARLLRSDGAVDPHLWFDVSLWMSATEILRDAFVALDPGGRDIYEANAKVYLDELTELDRYVRAQVDSIPKERRALVTAHDAFAYFGRAYGFEVLGIQGLSTEAEAAVSRINELVKIIVERKIPAVFVESTISEKNVLSLVEGCKARGHKLTIPGKSLYSDAMGPAGTPEGTYTGMVRHNIDTIVEALR